MIIWGTRNRGKVLGQKAFLCPNCQQLSMTIVQQSRTWFTLFFIPIFPVGGKRTTARCGRCGFTYKMDTQQANTAFSTPETSAQM